MEEDKLLDILENGKYILMGINQENKLFIIKEGLNDIEEYGLLSYELDYLKDLNYQKSEPVSLGDDERDWTDFDGILEDMDSERGN